MELCFEHVSVSDRKHIYVQDLNLRLGAGQSAAIVGPSRSGKSTLLLLASGHAVPATGRVFISSQAITHANDSKNELSAEGMTPISQNVINQGSRPQTQPPTWRTVGLGPISGFAPLFETLTVKEHIQFQVRLHGQRGVKQRTQALIEAYELVDIQSARIKDLGQFDQLRTAFAIATAHRPMFVLLDEPERGLSNDEWQLARNDLKQMTDDGVGILFTTVLESAANWVDVTVTLPSGEVKYR